MILCKCVGFNEMRKGKIKPTTTHNKSIKQKKATEMKKKKRNTKKQEEEPSLAFYGESVKTNV